MDITDGGQALVDPQQGMSLRDYFAAAALTGMLARVEIPGEEFLHDAENMAIAAYIFADAMLAEHCEPDTDARKDLTKFPPVR
jgi:hypothetical protein